MAEPLFGMTDQMPAFTDRPSDTLPTQEMQAPAFDEDDVKNCVMSDFQNDAKDKEEWGWVSKREYDLKAYYGIKEAAMSQRPWPGASNYRVPITPTLLDTGWANLKASQRSADGKIVRVSGVGEEDIRKAIPLEALLNWQLTNDIPIDSVQDKNIFRTLLHGTGIVKVIQDYERNRVKVISFDIENFYIPIDAEGVQFSDNQGHVTQIIPLSKNDIEFRKELGIYNNLDKAVPGARITNRHGADSIIKLKDHVTGVNKEQRNSRETYFIAETYTEYRPKSGTGYGGGPSRAGVRPQSLIVWWSPNGGTIHRIALNPDKIVPFAKFDLYPTPGYFFSQSLPEKIKNIQEKADYADKQNTDAMDRSISPAMFVDSTDEFNTGVAQRVPGGIYPKGKSGSTVEFEPQPPRERGFENQYQQMWIEAREMTGLIDINMGAGTNDKTLGQTQIRSYRADIRFSSLVERFERGFKDLVDLVYHYDNKFMPTNTKIKVLGYSDYKSLSELFPEAQGREIGLGIEGKFDFEFAGAAVTDIERDRENVKMFYGMLIQSPAILQDRGTYWKSLNQLAEAYGVRDFETVMSKPPEALIMSAQEAIQRIVSGQTDIQPRPGIDVESYIYEVELFMRGQAFVGLMPEGQQALMDLRQRCYIIRAAEMQAMMDLQMVQQGQQAKAQAIGISEQAQKDAQKEDVTEDDGMPEVA
jgi:hypothetical protein